MSFPALSSVSSFQRETPHKCLSGFLPSYCKAPVNLVQKHNRRESLVFIFFLMSETSKKGRWAMSIPFPLITKVLIFFCNSLSSYLGHISSHAD